MGKRAHPAPAPRGRGATINPPSRFAAQTADPWDDGWHQDPLPPLRTQVAADASRSVISWNDSPDIPFDRSVNPYRGCEHGCVYCYARPGHAWLGLSPGLDFETRLFAKADAAVLLREELAATSYRCAPLALGAVTDAYQPVERSRHITRAVLELLCELRHPVTVVTKSALIERDIDLLGDLARQRLVRVHLSVTTLEADLARRLEPRAASPQRRLDTIARLSAAGIPVGVLVAPVIPVLTDPQLETILAAARQAGAISAGYTLLRLPLEVAELFRDWLEAHAPGQAAHVMARVRDTRGGCDSDAAFGRRMVGTGPYAALIAQRYALAARRLGYAEPSPLRTDLFRRPARGGQLSLF
jgi:DNA repair photolyase